MKLSSFEKETIILWNEAEAYAEVFTYNSTLQRKMMELCRTHPEKACLLKIEEPGSMTFRLPKKWIRVAPPRVPTQAQLEVLARMNARRHRKNY